MSTTTKSPKQLAAAAYRIARGTLPEYNSRYSPRKFTQPQLLVCLVLKTFFNTDYRGIVQILDDWPSLCTVFELKTVPHFTTLQKASHRLLKSRHARKLIECSVSSVIDTRKAVPLAALDATGLQSGHISPYFYKIRSKEASYRKWTHFTRWPKLAVIADVKTHLIISVHPTRGPGRDCIHFKTIINKLPADVPVKHIVADAGYDSEDNHRWARTKKHIRTTIPATVGRAPKGLPKTTYRRAMKRCFDKRSYCQRWQVETVFSMIKRLLGYTLYAHSYHGQCREVMLLALTHNLMIILLSLLANELFYRAEFGNLSHLYTGAKANDKQDYHNDDAPKPYWAKHSCGLSIGLVLLMKSRTHIVSFFNSLRCKVYDKNGRKH